MFNYMRFWLQANLGQRQRGATMIEYVLIVAVIAIVAIIGAQTLGGDISGVFGSASETIQNSSSGTGT